MTRPFMLAAILVSLSSVARAEDAPILAEYWTNNGSLPPEYAWETSVTIRQDGSLTLQHCTGYETEGSACKSRRAKVTADAMAAITAAAEASGLKERPAQETDAPIVGGSLTGGSVWLDGTRIVLLSQPAAADAERVSDVVLAIRAAIPTRFNRFLEE